jgi:hypothetical protein
MNIVTGQVVRLPAGSHTFLFHSAGGAGTLAATVADPNSSPALTAITDATFTKTGSAVVTYSVHGDVSVAFTITGDGTLALLNKS